MGSEEGACNPFGLNLSPIAEVTAGNKAALRVFSESSSVGNGDRGDTFGWRHPLVGIQGSDAMQYDSLYSYESYCVSGQVRRTRIWAASDWK